MADPDSPGPSHSKSGTMQNSAGTHHRAIAGTLKLPHFFFHDQNLDDFSTPSFEPPTPPVQSTMQGFVPERRYGQESDSATKAVGGHAQVDLFIEPQTPLTQQDVDQFYPALRLERRRRSSSLSAANIPVGSDEKSANPSESGSLATNHNLTYFQSSSQTSPDLLKGQIAAPIAGPITKQFSLQTLSDVFRRSNVSTMNSNEPMKVSDFEIHMMSPGSL